MVVRSSPVSSPEEVIDRLVDGNVSVEEAFRLFQDMEGQRRRPAVRITPASRSGAPPSPAAGSLASRTHKSETTDVRGDSDVNAERQREAAAAMRDLDELIGLTKVKQMVREMRAFVEIQRRRAALRLASEPMSLHMVFTGNPGTGKTTVARIVGRLFRALDVLPKGHLVEVERADLVGEYIGHTAQRTREQIKKANGGILFVDEAYSLVRGGEKDFGKEAIDTLVKAMEDEKDHLVVILAGYRDEMMFFLDSNPGLRSRLPIQIAFPDFRLPELLQIADGMLKQKEYEMNAETRRQFARTVVAHMSRCGPNSGNARMMRNLIEQAIRRQAVRLMARRYATRKELMELVPADFTEGESVSAS